MLLDNFQTQELGTSKREIERVINVFVLQLSKRKYFIFFTYVDSDSDCLTDSVTRNVTSLCQFTCHVT